MEEFVFVVLKKRLEQLGNPGVDAEWWHGTG